MDTKDITVYTDDRGTFRNIFDDNRWDIRRIYTCHNFAPFVKRGFHFHEHESKVFYVLKGSIKFIIIPMEPNEARMLAESDLGPLAGTHRPYMDSIVARAKVFTLSENHARRLEVPWGCANAWMNIEPGSVLLVASNRTTEQSMDDDIRFSPDIAEFKKLWEIQNR